ncbi:1,2-dihydroxy-3-keto-5-methylthiopentene dioxygenase [Stygiomarasmius scandens]|uniref:Acireductone dioxygenase n=1 Tax=Marasmiellus scandens TaxID=2682957 RepID=A0ABR1K3G8_9AGAR
MRAYYFDNLPGDQRLPHDYIPSRPVSDEALSAINVHHWRIPVEDDDHEEKLNAVAKERGYKNRDVISISKEGLGDLYEEKIKGFYQEHLHEDEEIRYILEGSGFFDIREAPQDEWIRLAVAPGDLLVVPAGIYHRFTLDEGNKVRTVRLFKDEPKWHAVYRTTETDANPTRVDYLRSIQVA